MAASAIAGQEVLASIPEANKIANSDVICEFKRLRRSLDENKINSPQYVGPKIRISS